MSAPATLEASASLQPFNTFGVQANAQWLTTAANVDELREALSFAQAHNLPARILGGGSNVLLTDDLPVVLIRMTGRGIHCVAETAEHVIIEAEAGESWHPFVQHCLQQGWYGLENLSLIPGTVGASPVQNIGAYGVEIKDVFHSLTALDRQTGELVELTLEQCKFAYRDSVLKQQRERWVVLRVRFRLRKSAALQLGYGPIRQALEAEGCVEPTPQDVSQVVCQIRSSKLPDPTVLGNAGSFFKNPVVPVAQYEQLKALYPNVVAYPHEGEMKLAAGWLIDQAGWKGHREGDAGVHAQQALVLVNYGSAAGTDILALAEKIQADIQQRYGVSLEIEPNVWPN